MEEADCSFDVEWECGINKWLNSGFGTYNPGILSSNTFCSTTMVHRFRFPTALLYINKTKMFPQPVHFVQLMKYLARITLTNNKMKCP